MRRINGVCVMKNVELEPARIPKELRIFERSLRGEPDYLRRAAKLCAVMKGRIDSLELSRFANAIRERAPNDAVVISYTSAILDGTVPGWHFACLDDDARNQAYKRALNKLITPDTVVLDVGAGCGLLSLFAAEAGARHVYAVEIEPFVAEKAKEVIALNGFSDRITVIDKDIRQVELGIDIPVKCDLLVQDIIWPNPFSRGVHSLLDYCKIHLMKPGAHICPQSIKIRGAVSGTDQRIGLRDYNDHFGFNFAPMNLLAPSRRVYPRGSEAPELLSNPFTMFEFDLRELDVLTDVEKRVQVVANGSGEIKHILRWLELEFPDGTRLENGPTESSCRALNVSTLYNPKMIKDTERLELVFEVIGTQFEVSLCP